MSYNSGCFVYFILFLLGISVAQGGEYLRISENKQAWSDANESCRLATPKLEYTTEHILIHFNQTVQAINNNDELWLGYYSVITGYEYIGCIVNETIIHRSHTTHRNVGSLSRCGVLCSEEMYIGLLKDACLCFEDLSNISSQQRIHDGCVLDCKNEGNIKCGGENMLSVYKADFENYKNTSGWKDLTGESISCLYYQQGNPAKLKWWPCNKSLFSMCNYSGIVKPLKTYNSWGSASQKCFADKSLPTVYANALLVVGAEISMTQIWTGICGRRIIRNAQGRTYINSDTKFGYLKDEQNRYLLKFESNPNKKKRKSICITDDIQTTNRVSTPSSTKQTTRNKSTTYVSKTVTSSSKTVQSTTEESASENVTEAGERLTQSQGSGAGIPIGVSTAVVLIIIAVVITFAILKRRGKVPNVCTNTNSSANSDNTKAIPPVNKNIYDTSIGPSYDQIGNVVSQQNIDINTDSDLNNSNYAHTYFVLEQHVRETEYGATASGKDDREMENTNDYNTLTLHTNYKTKNGMHVVDDTYDTTAKADKKLKDGIDKETYKLDDTDEDTYNHINNTHLKNSKTDNVYGVPDNLEYGYGNVGKNIKNKTHGEEGTYSHINN